MQLIKGNDGKAFQVSLNVGSYRRVLADLRIDLGLFKAPGPSGRALSEELRESVTTLFDVLWSIVRPKAQKEGVSRDDFDAALFGEPYIAAREAFFAEWLLFFRTLGREDDALLMEAYLTAAPEEVKKGIEHYRQGEAFSTTTSNTAPPSPASSEPNDSPSAT